MDEEKPWFKDVLKIVHAEKSPGVRAAVRFPIHLQVEMVCDGRTQEARTENVSANGISLVTREKLRLGRRLRIRMLMPHDVLGTPKDVHVLCKGRVMRCEAVEQGYLVAATIDSYSFSEPRDGEQVTNDNKEKTR